MHLVCHTQAFLLQQMQEGWQCATPAVAPAGQHDGLEINTGNCSSRLTLVSGHNSMHACACVSASDSVVVLYRAQNKLHVLSSVACN
jgi:hypothetical protein